MGKIAMCFQTTFIKPRSLMPGAVIGIIAPAGRFRREALDEGMTLLRSMGYALRPADGLFDTSGYLAGDDAHRAAQIHTMFRDDTVDAIMCARGGFGSLRILPMLDYGLLRANPKPFVGFSDITALHQAFLLKSGLVTFHGPMVCTLSRSDRQSRTHWQQVLSDNKPVRLVFESRHMITPGRAEGVLVGGNLSTLCHLLATPFAASYRDCILFIEDTGEALYRIDRMLVQMKLAGCFDGLAGLMLGAFKDCGLKEDIFDLVGRLFSGSKFPILAGLPAGHGGRNLTLPLGTAARLDADSGELIFLESATVA